jgi:hypothetical protein
MPEPSNETLANWLADVAIVDVDADALKGYQAVLVQATKCSPAQVLDVVAIAHSAAKPEKVTWFAEIAQDKQPAVELAGNEAIVVRLAAAATVRALSAGQNRVVAGLAAQSAEFLGLTPDLPEVPIFANATIEEIGDAVRARALQLDPVAPKVPGWIAEGFPDPPAEGEPTVDEQEWAVPIRGVAAALDALATDIHDRLGLLDEEYNVLWWSHAARSTIVGEPWSKINPPARRVALVAHELGRKVTRIPATPMIDGVGAVALGDAATKSISLAEVVIAARDAGVPVAGVEHTLLPISTAVIQAGIYTEDDTWMTVLNKMHGVQVKQKHPAAAIVRQIIREQQLGKLF